MARTVARTPTRRDALFDLLDAAALRDLVGLDTSIWPRDDAETSAGLKLTCDAPTTWWAPTAEHSEEHAQYGAVRVRAWADVAPQATVEKGHRRIERRR